MLAEPPTKLSVAQTVYPNISDGAFEFLHLYLIAVLGPFLAVFGAVSNVVNIAVYYKQKVKDSITVSYIALAIWDSGLSLLTLVTIICLTIEYFFPLPYIDVNYLYTVYFSYIRCVTHSMSTIVTVYLSVELCICIMIPLKVKLMFTKTRSIIVNSAMVVLCIAYNCPPWPTQKLTWQYSQRFNRSRLTIFYTAGRREADIYFGIFNGNVMPICSQIISVICAVLLISGINKSVRFRSQTTINQPKKIQNPVLLPPDTATNHRKFVGKQSRKSQTSTAKYRKLAKVTALITVVFLVCNVPVIAVALARTVVPALNTNTKMIVVLYYVVYVSTLINSSASIIVYYYANEKFRKTLLFMVLGSSHC